MLSALLVIVTKPSQCCVKVDVIYCVNWCFRHYCEWVPPAVADCLPTPYTAQHKSFTLVERDVPGTDLNSFESVYRVHEITSFETFFPFIIQNSIRNYMPKNVNLDLDMYAASPFEVRKAVRWRQLIRNSSSASV